MDILFVGKCRLPCILFLSFILSVYVHAEETVDYDTLATGSFWSELYPVGGWSLFCGYRFDSSRTTVSGNSISTGHIYQTEQMVKFAGCHSRMQCRESHNRKFMRMEADLHNIYPVLQTLNTLRYDFHYGLVSGEDWRIDDCDVEWKAGVLEPRKIARGNIARAMLYMYSRYQIPVDEKSLKLFRAWNRIDPPSNQEKLRNKIIERIQGNRNAYIDKPSLAEKRRITLLK